MVGLASLAGPAAYLCAAVEAKVGAGTMPLVLNWAAAAGIAAAGARAAVAMVAMAVPYV